MSTARRGNEAEAQVLNAFIQRGYGVNVPFGSGHPYDLLVDLAGQGFIRVQCKRAWPLKGGCLTFNARSTDHGKGRRSYDGLADIFGVYFPPNKAVYLVPLHAVTGYRGWLRIEPTRNNQRQGVTFASDFHIDRWTLESLLEVAEGAIVMPKPELHLA